MRLTTYFKSEMPISHAGLWCTSLNETSDVDDLLDGDGFFAATPDVDVNATVTFDCNAMTQGLVARSSVTATCK